MAIFIGFGFNYGLNSIFDRIFGTNSNNANVEMNNTATINNNMNNNLYDTMEVTKAATSY